MYGTVYYIPVSFYTNGKRNCLLIHLTIYPITKCQPNHFISPIRNQSPYPSVNIQKFDKSAHQFQALMQQASLFVNKVIRSNQFANELMNAAQLSNVKKVEELIRSTGIAIHFGVKFTPTAIQIMLDNTTENNDCCQMGITLKW